MTERIKCKHGKEKRMKYIDWLRPVIGAGIGYITNWIAVKMMFRPIKEYKIGKLRIPFTPGIIPKNKERISAAIKTASTYVCFERLPNANHPFCPIRKNSFRISGWKTSAKPIMRAGAIMFINHRIV